MNFKYQGAKSWTFWLLFYYNFFQFRRGQIFVCSPELAMRMLSFNIFSENRKINCFLWLSRVAHLMWKEAGPKRGALDLVPACQRFGVVILNSSACPGLRLSFGKEGLRGLDTLVSSLRSYRSDDTVGMMWASTSGLSLPLSEHHVQSGTDRGVDYVRHMGVHTRADALLGALIGLQTCGQCRFFLFSRKLLRLNLGVKARPKLLLRHRRVLFPATTVGVQPGDLFSQMHGILSLWCWVPIRRWERFWCWRDLVRDGLGWGTTNYITASSSGWKPPPGCWGAPASSTKCHH